MQITTFALCSGNVCRHRRRKTTMDRFVWRSAFLCSIAQLIIAPPASNLVLVSLTLTLNCEPVALWLIWLSQDHLCTMQRLVWATAAPPLTVRKAHSAAELRAAGCLRAAAFTVLPPDRSEFARQSFLRMKTDAAWQALEGKVAGTDTDYKDCTVTPLIALLPADTCPAGAEPACMLPAEVGVPCLCSRKMTNGLNAANVANAAYPMSPALLSH
jgi:hypothetical protein